MRRTPLKRGNHRLKRVAAAKRERKEVQRFMEIHIFLWNLFYSVKDPKCQSCDKPLYGPPRNYYFDHLIEKSMRPDLSMEKDNIFLCCLECHVKKTNGFPTEKHKEAIEKAKQRFSIN